MPTQIQIKRGSTPASGLTVGELALNTSTNQVYIGGTGGTTWVGGEVTGGVDMGAGSAASATRIPTQSGVYNYVRNNFVTSFNGLTGAVGGVTTSVANTFTALQSFNSGISASGGTFSSQLNAQNFRALTVGGDEGGQIDFGLPATNTTLVGGVAIDINQDRVRIFETGGTNRGVYIDLAGVCTGVGTNLVGGGGGGAVSSVSGSGNGISVSPTTGSVVVRNTGVHSFNGGTGEVTGASLGANTFTALNTFNSGISGDINISSTNATGNMYLLMARGAGVTAVFMDNTTTPLVYQPFQGNLGLKGITCFSGSDYLYITPTQITATNSVAPSTATFYFIAEGGNYFQSPALSVIGDIATQNSALCLSVDPASRTMTWGDGVLLTGVTSGHFGVNRSPSGMCADYAVEINSPTGKGVQLIYNDYTGAASNWVNMDVSSGGNFTVRPSGGLATVTGTLNVSAGLCAAGGTFSGDIAVNGGDITTTSTTATLYNTTATTVNIGAAATTVSVAGNTAGMTFGMGSYHKFKTNRKTTTSTSQTEIFRFNYVNPLNALVGGNDAAYAEIIITAEQTDVSPGFCSGTQITKILVAATPGDGIVNHVEYGNVNTNGNLATYTASGSGDDVLIYATPVSSATTVFKVFATLIRGEFGVGI